MCLFLLSPPWEQQRAQRCIHQMQECRPWNITSWTMKMATQQHTKYKRRPSSVSNTYIFRYNMYIYIYIYINDIYTQKSQGNPTRKQYLPKCKPIIIKIDENMHYRQGTGSASTSKFQHDAAGHFCQCIFWPAQSKSLGAPARLLSIDDHLPDSRNFL